MLRDGGRAVQRLQVPGCSFRPLRTGLGEALSLAREANGYTFASLSAGLDRKAPWFQIKEDPQVAATSAYVILHAIDSLKTIMAPILPHTPVPTHRTQKLHGYLSYEGQPLDFTRDRLFGTQHVVEYQEETRSHQVLTYDHSGAVGTWTKSKLMPDQALRAPAPLFRKLDESVVEEEYAQLEG